MKTLENFFKNKALFKNVTTFDNILSLSNREIFTTKKIIV